jgi:hypothetical protein
MFDISSCVMMEISITQVPGEWNVSNDFKSKGMSSLALASAALA